jgi:alpha-ketoglutarate-dependent taurine dioxygenase
MSIPDRRDIETATIRLSVFESTTAENPLHLQREKILEAFDDTGIVLLRGFSFDMACFEAYTQSLCDRFHTVSNSHKRTRLQGDGNTYKVVEENITLLGHTEGTYRAYPPSPEICFFMCSLPPDSTGGETILVDGAKFLDRLPKTLKERFDKCGITYEMYWEKDSWQRECSIKDTDELNALLTGLPGTKFSMHNEALHMFYTTSAITTDRKGNDVFATAILGHLPHITHPYYCNKNVHVKPVNRVYFGNGEELSDEIINALIDIHDTLAYFHRWQANDMLLIDNTRYLHGRTMTELPCERIIISRFGWLKKELVKNGIDS